MTWAKQPGDRHCNFSLVASGSAFLSQPGPIAFAHRGGAAEAPENSWAAFERAVELDFHYVETDVRTTADGVAVAIHDPALERTTGHVGLVSRTSSRDLDALRLGDGGPVPRLEDLLAAWPDLRWNIDVKQREAVVAVAGAIRRTCSKDRALVTAFAGRRARRVRAALGPELATGAGRLAVALLVVAKAAPWVRLPAPASAAQVPVRQGRIRIVDGAFVRACHRAGMAVHVWTVDDRSEMERLLDLGVDGIMTDRPSVLKEVLEKRGQWA